MIQIYKNPNGDTRTASKDVTFEQFQEANTSHIDDVRAAMDYIADLIQGAGELHDCTKKTQEAMFYRDFKNTLEFGTDFVSGDWYQLHIKAERHHLLSHCPDDVNLIDVLEMIADCVCAGMARSGEVRDLEISPEILDKAVKNTVALLKDKIEVVEPQQLIAKKGTKPDKLIIPAPYIDPREFQIGDFPPSNAQVHWTDHTTVTGDFGNPDMETHTISNGSDIHYIN